MDKIAGALLLVGSFVLQTSCVTSGPSEKPCLDFYSGLKAKNSEFFAGYGVGADDNVAANAARSDLASQIATNISSQSTVNENNTELSFNSETIATTQGLFLGLEIAKRCPSADGGSQEAVARLSKNQFFSNLTKELKEKTARADHFMQLLGQAQNDYAQIKALIDARAFLKQEQGPYKDHLAVCQNFRHCLMLSNDTFTKLGNEADRLQERVQFSFVAENYDAQKNEQKIMEILQKSGYFVRKNEKWNENDNLAKTSCLSKVFSSSNDTSFEVAEVSCQVDFIVQGKLLFFQKLSGKGMGKSGDLAIGSAMNRLENGDL